MATKFGLPILGSLALAGWSLHAGPADAANYALVIGIDEYAAISDLRGAVNDARWIAQGLAEFGVTDLTVLLNEDATRENIVAAYQSYLETAQEGDTIIFTFAGHGRFVPDENGDEPSATDPDDIHDETLVLSAFSAEQSGEEIIDDELSSWFMDAYFRGINVVFVSDSCHSGTVSRGGRLRMVDEYALSIDVLSRPLEVTEEVDEQDLDNLIFLSGAPEAKPVQEVVIDGRYHGALSYSFGKALRGLRGDLNSDGAISRDELGVFVPRAAKAYNDGRVLPDLVARTGPDFTILTPDTEIEGDDFVIPGDFDQNAAQPAGDPDKVPLSARPDLIWDRLSGDITDGNGETVASQVPENFLADVNAKFELLALAQEALTRDGLEVSVNGRNGAQAESFPIGTPFTIEAGPTPYPYLTIFNLANNGEVQLIYPLDGSERAPHRIGSEVSFGATAKAPIGFDHVIAIASQEEPQTLRQQLGWNMTTPNFVATLERLTVLDNIAVGITGLVTVEQ